MTTFNTRLCVTLDEAKRRGLTVAVIRKEMAERGHPISASAISNWRAGRYPSVLTAIALSEILGTTVNYLFSPESGGGNSGEKDGFGQQNDEPK